MSQKPDKEFSMIRRLTRGLEELDPETAWRVIEYVHDRARKRYLASCEVTVGREVQ